MASPLFRIDSRLPMVWRTPSTLQIGVDPPLVVLENLSEGALIFLEALAIGLTPSGATLMAREAGIPLPESQRILKALSPVLKTPKERPRVSIAIHGHSAHRGAISAHLHALGHPVTVTSQTPPATETLLLGNYVLDPKLYRGCLRTGLPHTPVVFQDQSVIIGPRVTPGVGPCLHCVWENAAGQRPHHHAVMSQLWRQAAPADTLDMALLATTQVLELITHPRQGLVLRIDALTRRVTRHREKPSTQCQCRSLGSP